MKVTVAGDFKEPILFKTNKATALLIDTEDGQPAVIYKFLANKNGYLRLTRGEDKNFEEVARQLQLK